MLGQHISLSVQNCSKFSQFLGNFRAVCLRTHLVYKFFEVMFSVDKFVSRSSEPKKSVFLAVCPCYKLDLKFCKKLYFMDLL